MGDKSVAPTPANGNLQMARHYGYFYGHAKSECHAVYVFLDSYAGGAASEKPCAVLRQKAAKLFGRGAAASEIIVVIGCAIFLQRVAGNKEFFAFGSYFKNACAAFVVLTVVRHKARYEEKENESDGAAPND